MDLADIYKPLKEKEEWDTPVLCIDLYENPGDEGSVLPGRNNLATWLPQEVTPYYHTGGGRDVRKRITFFNFAFNIFLLPVLISCHLIYVRSMSAER